MSDGACGMTSGLPLGLVDHRDSVAVNDLWYDPLWMHPCLAYNLQLDVDECTRAALSEAAEPLRASEPGLLVCPPSSYHISVAALLPVREPNTVSKQARWSLDGEKWREQAAQVAARHAPYAVNFRRIVATRAAVLAVAEESSETFSLRNDLAVTMGFSDAPIPQLTHVTLFRYRQPFLAPGLALAWMDLLRLDIGFRASQLRLVREDVYPSIVLDLLATMPLSGT